MKKRHLPLLLALLATGVVLVTLVMLHRSNLDVLNPQGIIASKERDLMMWTVLLGLIVVLPVFALTFFIAWKYRAGNHRAHYAPDWDHNTKLEFMWWAIPCIIITVLAVLAWQSSHDLDPFKPIASSKKPLTVQVVALQWKWLFIYPEQHIATVNYLQIPEKTPINFEITADAPMNSFWIPKLGGQVYAMAGMSTQLHLMANEAGVYDGSSANLSGKGFSDMRFKVHSLSENNFDKWAAGAAQSDRILDWNKYVGLAKPGVMQQQTDFTLMDNDVYNKVVMKYMMPAEDQHLAGVGAQ